MSEALVILSGGQDSTTCVAVAKNKFDGIHTITFDYGQRHKVELESAEAISQMTGALTHEVIQLGPVLAGDSPLISKNELGKYDSASDLPDGVEPTFIPGRNILFLTIASNRAYCLGVKDIFTGVCQEDFAGYWDCRQVFIDAMQIAISQGIAGSDSHFKIHTPLMDLNKAQSVLLAKDELKDEFESVMAKTHTCYDGIRGGCGKCHACHLRDRGFKEAGIDDPLWEMANAECQSNTPIQPRS